MKTNEFVKDLNTKSAAELNDELVAAKKELFNLRFQNATNQLDNTSVKAIWNFAHTDLNLKLPKDVIVENVHLSESLMRLSYNLTRYEAEHPKNN